MSLLLSMSSQRRRSFKLPKVLTLKLIFTCLIILRHHNKFHSLINHQWLIPIKYSVLFSWNIFFSVSVIILVMLSFCLFHKLLLLQKHVHHQSCLSLFYIFITWMNLIASLWCIVFRMLITLNSCGRSYLLFKSFMFEQERLSVV